MFKPDSYIDLLETLVISLLAERANDQDIKAVETENPAFKGHTFSAYNVRDEISKQRAARVTSTAQQE